MVECLAFTRVISDDWVVKVVLIYCLLGKFNKNLRNFDWMADGLRALMNLKK